MVNQSLLNLLRGKLKLNTCKSFYGSNKIFCYSQSPEISELPMSMKSAKACPKNVSWVYLQHRISPNDSMRTACATRASAVRVASPAPAAQQWCERVSVPGLHTLGSLAAPCSYSW